MRKMLLAAAIAAVTFPAVPVTFETPAGIIARIRAIGAAIAPMITTGSNRASGSIMPTAIIATAAITSPAG